MTAGPPALDDVERRVAHARHTMTHLAGRLAASPINRALYAELQSFLDRLGVAACDAVDQLAARGSIQLHARLVQLVDPAGEMSRR